jgi:hypothetical protein
VSDRVRLPRPKHSLLKCQEPISVPACTELDASRLLFRVGTLAHFAEFFLKDVALAFLDLDL